MDHERRRKYRGHDEWHDDVVDENQQWDDDDVREAWVSRYLCNTLDSHRTRKDCDKTEVTPEHLDTHVLDLCGGLVIVATQKLHELVGFSKAEARRVAHENVEQEWLQAKKNAEQLKRGVLVHALRPPRHRHGPDEG